MWAHTDTHSDSQSLTDTDTNTHMFDLRRCTTHVQVKIEEWDWRAPIPWWGKQATVLLGSDVVYGDTSPQAAYFHLSRGIAEAMSVKPGTGAEGRGRDGVVGYFCNRVRSDCFEGSSVELFEKDLMRRGLVVEPISPTPEATQGFDEAEIEKM
jgi:hypothetical protein